MPFGKGGPVTDYTMDVGLGWHPLLHNLDTALKAVDPDYQTVQVKEKFGLLRVYIDHCTEGTQEVLDEFEAQSATICELCGKPGSTGRWGRHWIKTLCATCGKTRKDSND